MSQHQGQNQGRVEVDVEKVLNIKQEEYNEFIEQAENFAEGLGKKSDKPNQIRNFYDEFICKIEPSKENENIPLIGRLKIMLVYAKGRENISMSFLKNMEKFCDSLMNDCSENKLKRFKEFMEAFVAYRKIYGGN